MARPLQPSFTSRRVKLSKGSSSLLLARRQKAVKAIESGDRKPSSGKARREKRPHARGQTVVMLTLLIPILLGAVALGTDVAVFYYNWAQLQRAADSAALAGGTYLPRDPATAQSVAIHYAELNGVQSGQVTSVTFGNSNTTITVRVQRTVPYMFARVVGLVSNPVTASATAALETAGSVTGALPIGLNSTTPYTNGQAITMHSGRVAPGDWDGLALGCSGANCFRGNLANGYSGTISVGDMVTSEPGATSGPTSQGINARIQNGVAFDSSATYTNFQSGDPRAVIVPLVTWNGCLGSCTVPVTGFAAIWIDSVSGSTINATFISFVAPGSTGHPGGTNTGTQHCALVE
jgi:Flp pilus assembly protein TadG